MWIEILIITLAFKVWKHRLRNRLGINGEATSEVSEEEITYIKEKRQRREESIKKANHDSLIKKAMESPIAARELLGEYLPA